MTPFVSAVIAAWNAQADEHHKWHTLRWNDQAARVEAAAFRAGAQKMQTVALLAIHQKKCPYNGIQPDWHEGRDAAFAAVAALPIPEPTP